MTKRLHKLLDEARTRKAELDALVAEQDSYAHRLASQSLQSHIDDLTQQLMLLEDKPVLELLEFRLIASRLEGGSVPLHLLSRAADEIRKMIGFAALRLTQGGLGRKRVPDDIYADLDLRLAGVLPGSSRLVITAASQRDLFGDGLSKGALDRIFGVLDSQGKGGAFLESVTDLGPSSARRLRDFLHLLRSNAAELDLSWRYSGEIVRNWGGTHQVIDEITHALDVTELVAREEVVLSGIIELLSKRERIHLLSVNGETIRVLFPKRLLPDVSALHLDQQVKLLCSVTETENPLTGESSVFYELIRIIS